MSAPDPLIGRLVDARYQVRSRIARGGMATVYLATDLRLERRVAIKVMHSHLTEDAAFRERFIQEARSAARLAHPNVVNVFDQGQDSEMAYLVMEYLPGITLRDLLDEHRKLTDEQTMDVMEAVLSGLAAAHKAGIVHRDLKPENVLLADDGRIKIGDFGLARAASAATATGQALLGTIAYLSPELLTRGVADARSDIYAIGIMMYEMLTGEQPFKGEQPMQIAYQHANDTVPAPSAKVPGVAPELDELVLWATARDPEARPRDARAMLAQLFEAQNAIHARSGLGSAGSHTVVLPAALGRGTATAETQVLSARHRTGPITAPSATRLELGALARRRRGYWLLALVLMLTALSGGTGWYFGLGPGSGATLPQLAGASPAEAEADLTALGFTVRPDERYDVAAPAGTISGTDPAAGTFAVFGTEVILYTSLGPEQLPIPKLVGIRQSAAEAAILGAGFTVGEVIEQFDGSVGAGIVIAASRPDGRVLAEGEGYDEQGAIFLTVSLGAIPNVVGSTYDDAAAALAAVGLVAVRGEEVYDDALATGLVTSATGDDDGAVHRNDSIRLTISKGPQPVPVPNVVGRFWGEAKPMLEAAGFTNLDYNTAADSAPWFVQVKSTRPEGGSLQPKGTTIVIAFVSGG